MNPALLQKGSNSFRTDSEIKDHEGLEPVALPSPVKHSTTEPLSSLIYKSVKTPWF